MDRRGAASSHHYPLTPTTSTMRIPLTPEVRARINQVYEAAWPILPARPDACFGTTPGCDHPPGPRGWCSMCRERLLTMATATPLGDQPAYAIAGHVRFVQSEYRRYVAANPRSEGASRGGATKRANSAKKRAFLEARDREVNTNAVTDVAIPLADPPAPTRPTTPNILLNAAALRTHLARLERVEALRAELAALEAEVLAVCGG